MTSFYSLRRQGEAEWIVSKSRFIGISKPISSEEQALEILDTVKKAHPQATHCCYAYLLGLEGEIKRFSDDGEPSGTAGMPILEVLTKEGLTNTLCVVVRYFGGTLLGAGGLVRAYSKAAKLSLNQGEKVKKYKHYESFIHVDYAHWGKLSYLLETRKIRILNRKFEECVRLKLLLEEKDLEEFQKELMDLTHGEAFCSIGEERYAESTNGK